MPSSECAAPGRLADALVRWAPGQAPCSVAGEAGAAPIQSHIVDTPHPDADGGPCPEPEGFCDSCGTLT